MDYLHHSVATAAELVKAGVPTAIGSFGDERAGQAGPGATRFLAESAALAASRGLTREQALAAITIDAARILGIDKGHGSIDKGKAAGESVDFVFAIDIELLIDAIDFLIIAAAKVKISVRPDHCAGEK